MVVTIKPRKARYVDKKARAEAYAKAGTAGIPTGYGTIPISQLVTPAQAETYQKQADEKYISTITPGGAQLITSTKTTDVSQFGRTPGTAVAQTATGEKSFFYGGQQLSGTYEPATKTLVETKTTIYDISKQGKPKEIISFQGRVPQETTLTEVQISPTYAQLVVPSKIEVQPSPSEIGGQALAQRAHNLFYPEEYTATQATANLQSQQQTELKKVSFLEQFKPIESPIKVLKKSIGGMIQRFKTEPFEIRPLTTEETYKYGTSQAIQELKLNELSEQTYKSLFGTTKKQYEENIEIKKGQEAFLGKPTTTLGKLGFITTPTIPTIQESKIKQAEISFKLFEPSLQAKGTRLQTIGNIYPTATPEQQQKLYTEFQTLSPQYTQEYAQYQGAFEKYNTIYQQQTTALKQIQSNYEQEFKQIEGTTYRSQFEVKASQFYGVKYIGQGVEAIGLVLQREFEKPISPDILKSSYGDFALQQQKGFFEGAKIIEGLGKELPFKYPEYLLAYGAGEVGGQILGGILGSELITQAGAFKYIKGTKIYKYPLAVATGKVTQGVTAGFMGGALFAELSIATQKEQYGQVANILTETGLGIIGFGVGMKEVYPLTFRGRLMAEYTAEMGKINTETYKRELISRDRELRTLAMRGEFTYPENEITGIKRASTVNVKYTPDIMRGNTQLGYDYGINVKHITERTHIYKSGFWQELGLRDITPTELSDITIRTPIIKGVVGTRFYEISKVTGITDIRDLISIGNKQFVRAKTILPTGEYSGYVREFGSPYYLAEFSGVTQPPLPVKTLQQQRIQNILSELKLAGKFYEPDYLKYGIQEQQIKPTKVTVFRGGTFYDISTIQQAEYTATLTEKYVYKGSHNVFELTKPTVATSSADVWRSLGLRELTPSQYTTTGGMSSFNVEPSNYEIIRGKLIRGKYTLYPRVTTVTQTTGKPEYIISKEGTIIRKQMIGEVYTEKYPRILEQLKVIETPTISITKSLLPAKTQLIPLSEFGEVYLPKRTITQPAELITYTTGYEQLRDLAIGKKGTAYISPFGLGIAKMEFEVPITKPTTTKGLTKIYYKPTGYNVKPVLEQQYLPAPIRQTVEPFNMLNVLIGGAVTTQLIRLPILQPLPVREQIYTPISILERIQQPLQIQQLVQVPQPVYIQQPIKQYVPPPMKIPPFVPPPLPPFVPPLMKIPPFVPPFGYMGKEKGKKGFIYKPRAFKYAPSLAGISLGIKIGKAPGGKLSGIGIRGIQGMSNKKLKKFMF